MIAPGWLQVFSSGLPQLCSRFAPALLQASPRGAPSCPRFAPGWPQALHSIHILASIQELHRVAQDLPGICAGSACSICPARVRALPSTCPSSAQDLPTLCPRSGQDLPKLCPASVQDLQSIEARSIQPMPNLCPRTAQVMPKVCPESVGDLPNISPASAESLLIICWNCGSQVW